MCRRVTSSGLPSLQAPFEQRPSASRLDNNTARSSYELGRRHTIDEGCISKTATRLRLLAMPRVRSQQHLRLLKELEGLLGLLQPCRPQSSFPASKQLSGLKNDDRNSGKHAQLRIFSSQTATGDRKEVYRPVLSKIQAMDTCKKPRQLNISTIYRRCERRRLRLHLPVVQNFMLRNLMTPILKLVQILHSRSQDKNFRQGLGTLGELQ